ncbi:hypothetical protein [Nocardia sp. NPDC005366]|uniref:hypothetical protein n=1 Tax=Nocardia sp. NPDC005366 TaxID=3156878 RepID=UPI0033B02D86
MSTEYDKTRTSSLDDESTDAHYDHESESFAPGGHTSARDGEVIDAEVIDAEREPTATDTDDGRVFVAEHGTRAVDESEPGLENTDDTPSSEPLGQQSPVTDDDAVVPLFDEQSLEQLRGRWRDLQGTFVDDPRDAVARADDLVEELIHELTATYAERKEIIADRWSDNPDTESLRCALRSYRAFFNQLLSPTS